MLCTSWENGVRNGYFIRKIGGVKMPLDKEHKCIYKINADKGIRCECSECKNCKHYQNVTK